jgi:hypothetical protein
MIQEVSPPPRNHPQITQINRIGIKPVADGKRLDGQKAVKLVKVNAVVEIVKGGKRWLLGSATPLHRPDVKKRKQIPVLPA